MMERAAQLWPTQPAYFEQLSWLQLQQALRGVDPQAEFRAAEASLDKYRLLTPGDYRVWAAYGELYAERGKAGEPSCFARAEAAYRQATALFPGNAMLHTGWGLMYIAQERWVEAAAQFSQAIALDNTDAWAYRYLGDVLVAQGDLTGAEQAYLNALHWSPGMEEAKRGLEFIYDHEKQSDQGIIKRVGGDPGLHLGVQSNWNLQSNVFEKGDMP